MMTREEREIARLRRRIAELESMTPQQRQADADRAMIDTARTRLQAGQTFSLTLDGITAVWPAPKTGRKLASTGLDK